MLKSFQIPPTLKGILAILLWSTSSTIICYFFNNLPHMEILCLSFGISGGYTLFRLWYKREWHTLLAPLATWGLIFIGVLLQQLLYIPAFSYAKPAEADLIIYLWPSLAVILSALYFKERIRISHVISILFGSLAIISLTYNNVTFVKWNIGHILAFCSACSWAVYCVFSRSIPKIHPNMFGLAYLVGFFLVLPSQLTNDQFVIPTLSQALIFLYFSLLLTIGAFSLWTAGVQEGKSRYLMLTTYFKPFFSLSLLLAFGIAELTPQLFIAALFIIISGLSTNLAILPKRILSIPKANNDSISAN